jgi:hypothetical protein
MACSFILRFHTPFTPSPPQSWVKYTELDHQSSIGLHAHSCTVYTAKDSLSPNFPTFKEPVNQFKGTNYPRLCCSLAGQYDNPIPIRFLAPIDCLKIPAQPTLHSVSFSLIYRSCTRALLVSPNTIDNIFCDPLPWTKYTSKNTPNGKCRLNWCYIELIDR